jgi:hypothetical protein
MAGPHPFDSSYYRSGKHLENCLKDPVLPACFLSVLLTSLDISPSKPLSSVALKSSIIPQHLARNFAIIYGYNVLQCPMEALHGRQSALHDAIAGGTTAYFAIERGFIAVPFINTASLCRRYPQLTPAMVGAAVYGTLAGCLGLLAKPM